MDTVVIALTREKKEGGIGSPQCNTRTKVCKDVQIESVKAGISHDGSLV